MEEVDKERKISITKNQKNANFIVVDCDLCRKEFDGAKVERTYFEGECVWDSCP